MYRSVVNTYPDVAAFKPNVMLLTSFTPAPDYMQIASASSGYAEKVDEGDALPAALARAIETIRTERRSALLDVRVAVSDQH